MPRLRRKNLAQRDWTRDHRLQLQSGHDWFGLAFGDITDCPMELRVRWPFGEVRNEMQAAWDDLRDEMLAEAEQAGKVPPWAYFCFDRGMSGREAKAARDAEIELRMTPRIDHDSVDD